MSNRPLLSLLEAIAAWGQPSYARDRYDPPKPPVNKLSQAARRRRARQAQHVKR